MPETQMNPLIQEMATPNKYALKRLDSCAYLAGQGISSVDSDNRTVDIVFFTGIDIPRMDWWSGKGYVLRFDPKGADLSYLNNGAPVLDNHNSFSGSVSQKGRVEKAWEEKGKFHATLRFSKRGSVDELWQDIEDKIVTKFSMGVEILKLQKVEEKGQEIRTALKWRPFELSIAPIPADFNTTTLAADGFDGQSNNNMGNSPGGKIMPQVETTGENAQENVTETAKSIIDDHARAETQAAVIAETARIISIRKITKQLGLSADFGDKHIEGLTKLDDFRRLAIDEQARVNDQLTGIPMRDGRDIRMVSDEVVKRREAMSGAVAGLMDSKQFKDDGQNPFVGLSIKQIAMESVRLQMGLRGIPPMNKVVELAMQNTADFAYVLENTARKQLLNRYEAVNPTYRIWCKRSTTPDFKTMSRVRLSEAPAFLAVPEGSQITLGTMSDSREQYALATYGRGVSFTRQMLINDDLGAFNDLIGAFGMQAARLENKTVYYILYANPAMADGNNLFDGTNHSNTGTGAIGNTAFDSMFGTMGAQTGLDGETVLNLVPKFLIVPKAKEATAIANLLPTGPNLAASSQNWFSGRLTPVADGELDTNGSGTTKWYAAADPDMYPGIEYAHLEGAAGPQFIRKENESGILGIQFYAYLDFAAKAVDWRPLYYSTGS